ncbi:MAG: hypothetical protein ACRDQ4_06165 [Pseudonocardiaceae bacterium]
MIQHLLWAGGLELDGTVTFLVKANPGTSCAQRAFYNVATEIERLDADPDSPPLLPAYGEVSPHERSHGESFLDLG